MRSDALVLLVGKDEALLQTRKLILGSYFQVDVAGRVSHAAQLISERSFDLIVLCSTLSGDECERAQEHAAAQSPRPKILKLFGKGREILSHGTDNELNDEVGPMVLARKIAAMLGLDIKANGRGISEVRLVGID
jgi:hypothetical protein